MTETDYIAAQRKTMLRAAVQLLREVNFDIGSENWKDVAAAVTSCERAERRVSTEIGDLTAVDGEPDHLDGRGGALLRPPH